MKKWMTLLLALAMVFSLAACSSPEEPAKSETAETRQETEKPAEKPEEPQEKEEAPSVEERVLVDTPECTVTLKGVEPDNMWGYTVKVLLENKSADVTYTFASDTGAVDGVQCDPLFACDVAPGKKSNEDISFSSHDLEKLLKFTDIEFNLRVRDSSDWMADPVVNETVHVYPYGQDKVSLFVREAQSGDTVLVDNENVSVIVTGYEEDSIWGYAAKLFLVNKTDKQLMFAVDEAAVNGFMMDPFYATTVLPGKCDFSAMTWSDSAFAENGVEEVEEIEFKFKVYDANDWTGGRLVDEVFTLNP